MFQVVSVSMMLIFHKVCSDAFKVWWHIFNHRFAKNLPVMSVGEIIILKICQHLTKLEAKI